MQSFDVAGVPFGSGELSFLLGPCVVESGQHAMFMAQEISDICKHVVRLDSGTRNQSE